VKRRRVLVIMHEGFVPPDEPAELEPQEREAIRTELSVVGALEELGHKVRKLALHEELKPLRKAIRDHRPHVVFNLLEDFRDQILFDQNLVAYLELRGTAYTGCNSRGLMLGRDKALSKKILHYHRIRVPRFFTVQRGRRVRRPKALGFPLIVKSQVQEASAGIAQASVVRDDAALAERVSFMHESIGSDAIVEQYIEGREIYSAVIGNHRLQVLPTWELVLDGMPNAAERIATRSAKFDTAYQDRHGIDIVRARGIDDALEARIAHVSKRICRRLYIDGYVRIDYRLTDDGRLYFLEANPNPDIAASEEFASAAKATGMSYDRLIHRIVELGIRRG
jgi:D-alanine-D-alanine ligase